ncbi:unnamed protein product [Ostreobium quekettii]|uniref:Uncharacterized protein n=1 Tax=Ostreobium quekettii TaxID=121088 RepID=A0A8S1IV59_9CHLO|nr:unnamed protein product [Ostreobium quekettii]
MSRWLWYIDVWSHCRLKVAEGNPLGCVGQPLSMGAVQSTVHSTMCKTGANINPHKSHQPFECPSKIPFMVNESACCAYRCTAFVKNSSMDLRLNLENRCQFWENP